jgi:hypothetical protein
LGLKEFDLKIPERELSMAFADPLVLTYGAGTKSLDKINPILPYGNEYLLRESTQQFVARIRHNREKATQGGIVMERHNVELTRTVFGVDGAPDIIQQAYLIFRFGSRDSVADAAELGAALSDLMDETAYNDLGKWLS